MICHEVDYEIFGDDMQIVEVELDPSEVVIAEAGAMNYLEDGITFETKMGDGSNPGGGMLDSIFNIGKRVLTGESIFMTHFSNTGAGKKRVAFAAPYPGKIIPIDMSEIGGELTCQKDAFLCAAFGTNLDIAFHRKLGAGFFGGEGFILQELTGVHECHPVTGEFLHRLPFPSAATPKHKDLVLHNKLNLLFCLA